MNMNKTKIDYINMQKNYYNRFETENDFKDRVVGNYNSHEKYPYKEWLLYENGLPIFDTFSNKFALDFGCGMGRMIPHMSSAFEQVDGVDIGENLIEYCKKNYPSSNFWVSNGNDCGDAYTNHYDFAYSLLCFQHIASFDIRMEILNHIKSCLNDTGRYCIQMYSNRDLDHVKELLMLELQENDTENE